MGAPSPSSHTPAAVLEMVVTVWAVLAGHYHARSGAAADVCNPLVVGCHHHSIERACLARLLPGPHHHWLAQDVDQRLPRKAPGLITCRNHPHLHTEGALVPLIPVWSTQASLRSPMAGSCSTCATSLLNIGTTIHVQGTSLMLSSDVNFTAATVQDYFLQHTTRARES